MALNIIKIPSKSIPKKTYRETIFSQIKAYSFCVLSVIALKYYCLQTLNCLINSEFHNKIENLLGPLIMCCCDVIPNCYCMAMP